MLIISHLKYIVFLLQIAIFNITTLKYIWSKLENNPLYCPLYTSELHMSYIIQVLSLIYFTNENIEVNRVRKEKNVMKQKRMRFWDMLQGKFLTQLWGSRTRERNETIKHFWHHKRNFWDFSHEKQSFSKRYLQISMDKRHWKSTVRFKCVI